MDGLLSNWTLNQEPPVKCSATTLKPHWTKTVFFPELCVADELWSRNETSAGLRSDFSVSSHQLKSETEESADRTGSCDNSWLTDNRDRNRNQLLLAWTVCLGANLLYGHIFKSFIDILASLRFHLRSKYKNDSKSGPGCEFYFTLFLYK